MQGSNTHLQPDTHICYAVALMSYICRWRCLRLTVVLPALGPLYCPLQRYINSLRQAEAKLDALLPAGQRKHKGSLGEGTGSDGEGEGAEDADGEEGQDDAAADGAEAAWEEGAIKVGATLTTRVFCWLARCYSALR